MKRKAAFAKRSAAKRSRTSKTDKLVPTVVDALAHADVLSANLRSLFKNALPIVLNTNKADRHAYEAEVVSEAQKALGQVQTAMEQAHAAALAKQNVVIAPKEEANRHAAKKAAEAHLEATKTHLEATKGTKKACDHAVQDAADAVKVAQKEDNVADKDLQRVVDKKNNLESSLANEFALLKEGTSAGAQGKKAVDKLLAIGKAFGLDSTLLFSFPIACKKIPVTRSTFESMMFNNLQTLIEHQITAISQQVAEAEPVKAAKDAAVAGAKQHLEAAEGALTAATADLEASHTAHKDANKEVHRADVHVRKIFDDMKDVCDAQDDLAFKLKNMQENIWGAFNALKEKEPEPEPVEPEPVVEDVAAEAAPEEAAPEEAAVVA